MGIFSLQKRGQVIVAMSVISILGAMIPSVTAFVLDILPSFSISLSIVILASAVYIKSFIRNMGNVN